MRPAGMTAGFTLTEALIVMTILTVVITLGLPTMTEFVREQRIRAVSFDLVSDLMLARSEAVKRSGVVSLNAQGQGGSQGWQVTVDEGLHQGTVVQQRTPPGNQVVLAGPSRIEFDRNGRLAAGGTAQIEIRDSARDLTRRCISIDLSGMPQTREAQNGGCS
ncbi:MAG: GspH/FimT family pseudopilin [Burkholderiaceae bacterium]